MRREELTDRLVVAFSEELDALKEVPDNEFISCGSAVLITTTLPLHNKKNKKASKRFMLK